MVGSSGDFCFPAPSILENARLKLTPWVPSLHSPRFVESIKTHPELLDFRFFGPFNPREPFDSWYEETIGTPHTYLAFAVFDKTRESVNEGFAGMIILRVIDASTEHLSVEIGLTILPDFHRTHVSSNVIGLLLHWLLNPTSDPSGGPTGLGLRRVCWSADVLNTHSIALAERLGMKHEAVLRWARVLPVDRAKLVGRKQVRKGDPREEHPGRDTARLAICWDDWIGGGREKVDKEMQRTS